MCVNVVCVCLLMLVLQKLKILNQTEMFQTVDSFIGCIIVHRVILR